MTRITKIAGVVLAVYWLICFPVRATPACDALSAFSAATTNWINLVKRTKVEIQSGETSEQWKIERTTLLNEFFSRAVLKAEALTLYEPSMALAEPLRDYQRMANWLAGYYLMTANLVAAKQDSNFDLAAAAVKAFATDELKPMAIPTLSRVALELAIANWLAEHAETEHLYLTETARAAWVVLDAETLYCAG